MPHEALSGDRTVAGPAPPAAIVVPVHGAAGDLDACLAALAATTDLERHPLILVLDGPQPDAVEAVLAARVGSLGEARVLRVPERRGFPAAANRGLGAEPRRDAVLLNSDVETSAGWLERLAAAARSAPDVASATPLTNSGTLASVPRPFEENSLPAGHDLASFAALVERVAARAYPRIPTGVGFCLYLRREALDRVGAFDEAAFGLGYGEEVDWCLRAAAAGFTHRLDDATFVRHRGGGSFGPEGDRRSRRAQRRLARRHPDWEPRLRAFMAEDPLRPVRERVLAALAPKRERAPGARPLRVVHVVHGWPPWNHAGTESYAARLVRAQALRHDIAVYARYAPGDRPRGSALELVDGGARVRLVANDFLQRDPLSRNALHDRRLAADFGRLLDEQRPDLVHVHHLAGHALTLPREATRRAVPLVWQLQDWWAACARANRLDASGRLCPGPAPRRCAACLPPTRLPPRALWGPLLYALRGALARRALGGAAAFLAGSSAVVEDHRRFGLLPPGVPVHLCDYGVPEIAAPPRRPPLENSPLRLGFVGTLAPHKGLHVAVAALAGLPRDRVRLEVWGEPRTGEYAEEVRRLAGGLDLRFHVPFPDSERAEILAGLDLLVAPSLGLESYGLAVAEALAAGVPVLASARGALADRLAAGGGALFDPERPETLRALIESALEQPERLADWRRSIPPQAPFARHATEVEEIYRSLLARERGAGAARG